MDGDNYWSMFWRIAMPLARPALIVTSIFEFKASWTDLTEAAHLPARPTRSSRSRAGSTTCSACSGRAAAATATTRCHRRHGARDAADDHHLLPRPAVLHRGHRHPGTQGLDGRVGQRPVAAGGDGARGVAARPVLALDIGGTKLAAGVVDAAGRVHSFVVEPTERDEGPDAGAGAAVRARPPRGRRSRARLGRDRRGRDRLRRAARRRRAGVLIAPPHLPGWRDVPVVGARRARVRPARRCSRTTRPRRPPASTATAPGAGTRNMVYLTISTGVGGGVVIDGAPLPRLDRERRRARPRHGRLARPARAAAAAGAAASRRTSRAPRSPSARARRGCRPRPPSEVAAAARGGRAGARPVWDETVEALACGLDVDREPLRAGARRRRRRRDAVRRAAARRRCASACAQRRCGPRRRACEIVRAALGDAVGVVGAAADRRTTGRRRVDVARLMALAEHVEALARAGRRAAAAGRRGRARR